METTAARRSNHGANVKRWREWRNINQDVLAEKIGVSQAALSGYEKRDKLEPEILKKICDALNIPEEAIQKWTPIQPLILFQVLSTITHL